MCIRDSSTGLAPPKVHGSRHRWQPETQGHCDRQMRSTATQSDPGNQNGTTSKHPGSQQHAQSPTATQRILDRGKTSRKPRHKTAPFDGRIKRQLDDGPTPQSMTHRPQAHERYVLPPNPRLVYARNQTRLNTSVPLVPPKPKLFLTATSIFMSRAVLAQ